METLMGNRARLRQAAKILIALIGTFILVVSGYAGSGYLAARADASELRVQANALIANGRGAEGLGPGRIDQLLLVEDPGFAHHSGVDFSTAGAGLTTFTQSVAKRAGFDQFKPGIMKIRLMGYAIGLEHSLTKAQIIALWLDMVGMGRGPDGWMTGFYTASEQIYGRPPSQLTESEFLTLVAVPIAPRNFDLQKGNAALTERVSRIEHLVQGQCSPAGLNDVWLNGCAGR
jgi:monofunctional glycosyltransferase